MISLRSGFATLIGLVWLASAHATADTYPRQPGVDALHYVFRLAISDASNEIAGETTVTLKLVADGVRDVELDLANASSGQGMTVASVSQQVNGAAVALRFTHQSDRLRVSLAAPSRAGDEVSFTVAYTGIPAEGLRLIDNIHGERVVFSENWPNRARQWLPMIDHPYDKATSEFVVTAPAQYQVVANGLLHRGTGSARRRAGTRTGSSRCRLPRGSTRWASRVSRCTTPGRVKGVPLQTWVVSAGPGRRACRPSKIRRGGR